MVMLIFLSINYIDRITINTWLFSKKYDFTIQNSPSLFGKKIFTLKPNLFKSNKSMHSYNVKKKFP